LGGAEGRQQRAGERRSNRVHGGDSPPRSVVGVTAESDRPLGYADQRPTLPISPRNRLGIQFLATTAATTQWAPSLRSSLASRRAAACPVIIAGWASTLVVFSGPARRSLLVAAPCRLLTQEGAVSRSTQLMSLPSKAFRVLPAGATVCRAGFPPAGSARHCKVHTTMLPSVESVVDTLDTQHVSEFTSPRFRA